MTAAEAEVVALIVAIHEGGHAVVAAALGLPMKRAWARERHGAVEVDDAALAMRAGRARRRAVPDADPRVAKVAAALAWGALACGGEAAVEGRAKRRPGARWLGEAFEGAMSRNDRAMLRRACDGLAPLGIAPDAAAREAAALAESVVARHAGSVARLARALLARRALSGPEVVRALGMETWCYDSTVHLQVAAAALLASASPVPRPAL
jgi:hypothetical protein